MNNKIVCISFALLVAVWSGWLIARLETDNWSKEYMEWQAVGELSRTQAKCSSDTIEIETVYNIRDGAATSFKVKECYMPKAVEKFITKMDSLETVTVQTTEAK